MALRRTKKIVTYTNWNKNERPGSRINTVASAGRSENFPGKVPGRPTRLVLNSVRGSLCSETVAAPIKTTQPVIVQFPFNKCCRVKISSGRLPGWSVVFDGAGQL